MNGQPKSKINPDSQIYKPKAFMICLLLATSHAFLASLRGRSRIILGMTSWILASILSISLVKQITSTLAHTGSTGTGSGGRTIPCCTAAMLIIQNNKICQNRTTLTTYHEDGKWSNEKKLSHVISRPSVTLGG